MLENNERTFSHKNNQKTPKQKSRKQLTTNPQDLIQRLLNLYIQIDKEKVCAKLSKVRQLLLILIFITLPWGLGKHVQGSYSFVMGRLVNYLIPVVYVQDLLILFLICISFLQFLLRKSGITKNNFTLCFFFLFLLSCFFSVFFSQRVYPSFYFFLRIVIYFLFFISSLDLFHIPSVRHCFFKILAINVIFLGLLSIAQFVKQSSVFNNYLLFGEQPYNTSTPFIVKEDFSGISKIPPYGVFAHPNILGGFLAISIILLFSYILKNPSRKKSVILVSVLLGFTTLLLTRSHLALVSLIVGMLLTNASHFSGKRVFLATVLFISTSALILSLLFPFYSSGFLKFSAGNLAIPTLSVERRSQLLLSSFEMIKEKPFFGWGLNSFTYNFESFYTQPGAYSFMQPVHNVFALLAAEVGVSGAFFYFAIFLSVIIMSTRNKGRLYAVLLTQIIVLSCFDHYFFTIHQTYLLFILTLLMALTYTENVNCL